MGFTSTMITWQLWRAIHTPFVAHPLYYMRGMDPVPEDTQRLTEIMERNTQRIALLVILGVIAAVIHYGPAVLLFIIIGVPISLFLLTVPAVLLLAGTVYGLIAVMAIALTISKERHQGRLELLGATPYGLAGATWALGSIAVQKNILLKRIRNTLHPLHMITTFCVIFMLILFMIPYISDPQAIEPRQALSDVLAVLAVIIFAIIDLFQSGNIGSLIGMIVATDTHNTAHIQGRSLTTFLVIHLAGYMLIVGLCVLAWPVLGINSDIVYYGLCLFTAYAIREGITLVLWWFLIKTLDANYDELNTIVRIGIRRQRTIPHA